MKTVTRILSATAFVALGATSASATDLEVMHWWTSGGEAAAVAEFAKAFDATGNHWVDGAIAGGQNARPVMVSRITGGNPPGAFQFNQGRQAEDLIAAGLLRDISDIAEKNHWADVINPPSLLKGCTVDGKVYCVPVNIHSWQWLWLSNAAFEKAGLPVPKDWNEFVADAPKLRDAGILPLAMGQEGWQQSGAFNVLVSGLLPDDVYMKVFGDKDTDVAAGPEMAKVFEAAVQARKMSEGSNVQPWNDATNLVITGKAGGQIMGDWARGEFAVANMVAGKDYTCLPGLGLKDVLQAGGDAFYFPVLKDPAQSKAQEVLAETMLSPAVQVAFNLKKGSLPVRSDVDLNAADDCMKKGLAILASGHTLPDTPQLLTEDSNRQLNDLFTQFFADPSMTAEDTQKRFVDIIAQAE